MFQGPTKTPKIMSNQIQSGLLRPCPKTYTRYIVRKVNTQRIINLHRWTKSLEIYWFYIPRPPVTVSVEEYNHLQMV